MTSTILFHGPGAREKALDEANSIGRLLADPFGDEGLKVDEAKEAVRLLSSVPVGTELGIVLIGPMDLASGKSSDTLLKITEQFHHSVQPILWAHDLGSVSDTIKSRCMSKWAPSFSEVENEEMDERGRKLLLAFQEKREWEIPTLVKESKNSLIELISVISEAIAENPQKRDLQLWIRLRKILKFKNPSTIEIISAFIDT